MQCNVREISNNDIVKLFEKFNKKVKFPYNLFYDIESWQYKGKNEKHFKIKGSSQELLLHGKNSLYFDQNYYHRKHFPWITEDTFVSIIWFSYYPNKYGSRIRYDGCVSALEYEHADLSDNESAFRIIKMVNNWYNKYKDQSIFK